MIVASNLRAKDDQRLTVFSDFSHIFLIICLVGWLSAVYPGGFSIRCTNDRHNQILCGG
jgi:hypothetical protein